MLLLLILICSVSALYIIDRVHFKLSLPFILLTALCIRLAVTFLFIDSHGGDVLSYIYIGEKFLEGAYEYSSVYFPFILYLSAPVVLLKSLVPPMILFKLIFTIFDVGVTYLIYKITNDVSKTFLYAIHPIMLIVVNIHGYMEPIVLFFWLWSIYMYKKGKYVSSALLVSFATFVKPWPALFAFPFFTHTKKPMLFTLIILFPIVSVLFHSLVFHIPISMILKPIEAYRGVHNVWGIGAALANLFPEMHEDTIRIVRRLFFIAFGMFAVFHRTKSLISNIFATMLFFFSFTVSFGAQWLSWLVPLVIIVSQKGWRLFTVLATVYLTATFLWDAYPTNSVALYLRDYAALPIGLVLWVQILRMFYIQIKIDNT